ncbi:MAG: hypothetical protein DBX60_04310 [Bacillota bacterium]|nr:MAG: hypothetical protein DBX60_04310 [Bacillota bacterium]
MKDIKKMLKAQAKNVLPDEKLKANIKHELGYDAGTADALVLARADGGTEEKKGKQKVMIPLVALAAILLVLAIVLPLVLPGTVSPLPLPGGNKFADITNADSFYAYGAASVGSILASEGETSSVRAMTDESAREEKHIETVNRYMALVEGLLSEDAIETTAVEGNEEYRYGMKIGYTDLLGNAAHYTLYYNKHFLSAEQKDDETEEEYAIEGVLVAEGRTYPVRGNYETESEEDETEGELFFRAYLDEAESAYIEVTQEYESENEDGGQEVEREYVYSRYENGKRVERTTVEYESEEGELELKLTIEQEDVRDELVFESARIDGETVLLAEGKLSGEDVRFTVYIREGGYHYVFDDGSSSDHDRYDDDHDDDDRDDDDDDDDDDDRPWRGRSSASA